MSAETEFALATDPYRRELLVHCYRMLASYHDAEDVVQETYLRAWRGFDRFEGRSSVRTWLYRIATRACLSALDGAARRVLPSGLGGPSEDGAVEIAPRRTELPWLEPLPDQVHGDPADIAVRHESTRLAFVAALQQLPPRQRAALVLRDVLAWPAADVAELLDLSTAAVNSALQRARAHLASTAPSEELIEMTPDVDAVVLDRFVAAFEADDVAGLAALLRESVELEMPPFPTWFAGREAVLDFFALRAFTGSRRKLVATRANGCPAAATYVRDAEGALRAHSIQVLDVRDGTIDRIHVFLDDSLFECFGLPLVWSS